MEIYDAWPSHIKAILILKKDGVIARQTKSKKTK